MKKTKIAAIVACAALLVLGMAFTSLAANKWAFIDGWWYVVDSDGEVVAEEGWCKGQDGIKYWADEDGAWVVENWVYDGDDTYYVGADGIKATGWQYLADPDEDSDTFGDYFYYYFVPATGKLFKPGATQASAKLINDNYYCFDTETGKMLSGWCYLDGSEFKSFDIDESTAADFVAMFPSLATNTTAAYASVYYCGAPTEGWAYKGWNKLMANTIDSSDVGDTTAYWFYMNPSNGKVKIGDAENTATIEGAKYVLDEAGRMLTGFVPGATPSSFVTDNGTALAKEWIWTVPTDDVIAAAGLEEDVAHWFFGTKKGALATNTITTAKTTSTYWALDQYGIMLSGLYKFTVDAATNANPAKAIAIVPDYVDALGEGDAPVQTLGANEYYFYFGEEETDGSMKTGEQTVTIDGEEYTMRFKKKGETFYVKNDYSAPSTAADASASLDKTIGASVNGFNGGKFYIAGQAVCGDEDNGLTVATIASYKAKTYCIPCNNAGTLDAATITALSGFDYDSDKNTYTKTDKDSAYCVVKADGTIVKKASGLKDADGNKYYVNDYRLWKVVIAD